MRCECKNSIQHLQALTVPEYIYVVEQASKVYFNFNSDFLKNKYSN